MAKTTASAIPPLSGRTGGTLVGETLRRLGSETVFGLPGVHALPIWAGLDAACLEPIVMRTELSACFAADGYARASGRPAPLLLSTGPGALMASAGLMEAAEAHVPVIAVSSEVDSRYAGRPVRALHQLVDQRACFAPIVKWHEAADRVEMIPELLAEAWRVALSPPSGPVFVQIPADVLRARVDDQRSFAIAEPAVRRNSPADASLDEAAKRIAGSSSFIILAGNGVLRAQASRELLAFAEALDAPVVTTFMGKGAIPADHSLFATSATDEPAVRRALEEADCVFAIGTDLGEIVTGGYSLRFSAPPIHADADADRIGATYPALGLIGDARATLSELIARLPTKGACRDGRARARQLRELVADSHDAQGTGEEHVLLEAVRAALPRDGVHTWDMTILGYWAEAAFPTYEPRTFLHSIGSGTLGYAWPAAIGAAVSRPEVPVVAVVGDGGVLYGLAELGVAASRGVPVTLVIIEDGQYGVLGKYQRADYGAEQCIDLDSPDLLAVARAFGVRGAVSSPESLEADLRATFATDGPSVLVVPARPVAPAAV